MCSDSLDPSPTLAKQVEAIILALEGIAERLKALAASTAVIELPVDLDGPYGDPIIKAVDPKGWSGDSMKGRHLSECPSAYLELLARRYDYFADKAHREHSLTTKGVPLEPYLRREAARCRGWAQRHGALRDDGSPRPAASVTWPSDDGVF